MQQSEQPSIQANLLLAFLFFFVFFTGHLPSLVVCIATRLNPEPIRSTAKMQYRRQIWTFSRFRDRTSSCFRRALFFLGAYFPYISRTAASPSSHILP